MSNKVRMYVLVDQYNDYSVAYDKFYVCKYGDISMNIDRAMLFDVAEVPEIMLAFPYAIVETVV